jgi:hypothetical protein
MARRLATQDDVRKALAWCWKEIEADRMDVQKGRALVYCAMSVSNVLSEHSLEQRLEALEQTVAMRVAS